MGLLGQNDVVGESYLLVEDVQQYLYLIVDLKSAIIIKFYHFKFKFPVNL